jgi:hypothetical protein
MNNLIKWYFTTPFLDLLQESEKVHLLQVVNFSTFSTYQQLVLMVKIPKMLQNAYTITQYSYEQKCPYPPLSWLMLLYSRGLMVVARVQLRAEILSAHAI